ncbi:uroporphyrinogen-III C-methyltransferase [Neomegalonema sp.]|uniref:uroporphyrinogen-III C-methyltransferase n=1 Tax=Neomegalonema sp. TaxID=2039713 RepID=UPI00261344ED|nr:uroporphyrinogen-III C-methyltransferase [Neomegalonema sp.]MDD2868029.1 uroporphyrinogen-III C-methyltransferase [Neomegalonema sp.]
MTRFPEKELPEIEGAPWPEFRPGSVWLVGAGPGDPGLLTLHALNALRQADVVVHDALVDPRILALRRPDAESVEAGKRGGRPSAKQADISLKLIELARRGLRVLRLKGGDPFVFGRGGEEALALAAAGIPFRVTPGITAGVAGLAYAGIPATHRGINASLAFFTGHDQSGETPAIDWAALSRGAPMLVIYMGLGHLPEISAALIAAGRPPEELVAIVSNATLPGQRVLETTLARAAEEAAQAGIEPPALICVGPGVALRRLLAWREEESGAAS